VHLVGFIIRTYVCYSLAPDKCMDVTLTTQIYSSVCGMTSSSGLDKRYLWAHTISQYQTARESQLVFEIYDTVIGFSIKLS